MSTMKRKNQTLRMKKRSFDHHSFILSVIIALLPVIACIGYGVLPVLTYTQKKFVDLYIPVYLGKEKSSQLTSINEKNLISDKTLVLMLDNSGSYLCSLKDFRLSERYFFSLTATECLLSSQLLIS